MEVKVEATAVEQGNDSAITASGFVRHSTVVGAGNTDVLVEANRFVHECLDCT